MAQDKRQIAVDTPLGKDKLLLRSFSGTESISHLFNFDLEMICPGADLSKDEVVGKLVGKPVDIRLDMVDGSKRFFNGHAVRIAADYSGDGGTIYRAEVVPWLWFLTQTSDCRIFQEMKVPEIIEQIFGDLGFSDYDMKLSGSYEKLEYCVQYRETDFNFVSRLMQQVGIFYYFKHEEKKHTLVLTDGVHGYEALAESTVDFPGSQQATATYGDKGHISDWEHEFEFVSGKWTQTDYDFKNPSTKLETSESTNLDLPKSKDYEIYDYPGEYFVKGVGQNETKVRMEEEERPFDQVSAASNCRSFFAGGTFTVGTHPSENEKDKSYLVISIEHKGSDGGTYDGGNAEGGDTYSNRFTCIPDSVTYRPSRDTPKPTVSGLQTAVVVGPNGEEIYTDEYGRVKVQFHWDREGKNDELSSCFIRCAQAIAGKKWGFMAIPRIGQEVVVDFLEGDPDRPLIVGSVYNAEQVPHYDPVTDASKIYLKSNSTKGGEGFNELMFEDKSGSERLFMHAQKDMDVRVLNDSKERIYGNRHQIIGWEKDGKKGGNQSEMVYQDKILNIKRDQVEHIEGDYKVAIGGGEADGGGNLAAVIDSSVAVKIGAEGLAVKNEGDMIQQIEGSQSLSVTGDIKEKAASAHLTLDGDHNEKAANLSLDIGQNINAKGGMNVNSEAGMAMHLKAGMSMVIEAGVSLTLKVGGNFVSISPAGVFIQGTLVGINSGGAAGSGAGCSPQAPQSPDSPDEAEKAAPAQPEMAHKEKTGYKSSK